MTHDRDELDRMLRLPILRERLPLVLPSVASRFDILGGIVSHFYQEHDARCESPLEALFVAWWLGFELVHTWGDKGTPMAVLQPQVATVANGERYRLDFKVSIRIPDGEWSELVDSTGVFPLICVELDGHDFHERTKDQVIARNQRDRNLQQAGWRVFHVSGSELVRDGRAAVEEIYWYGSNEATTYIKANLKAH